MEQPPPESHDHDTPDAHGAPGVFLSGVRLNVGERPRGLVPLLTLGLVAAGVGWGATSLVVSLVQSRAISGSAVAASVGAILVAVALRLAFIQNWRVRAADRALRAHARRRLDDAFEIGAAPDLPTLCWCIALAAGCSNSNPRPLRLRRLRDAEARLGITLPRVWVFDPGLEGAVAAPTPPPPLPTDRRRVIRPRDPAPIGADLVGVLGLVGALVWALVSTGAWFNGPPVGPGRALVLFGPPIGTGVGSLLVVFILNRWARRRDRSVEASGDRPVLRRARSALTPPITFPADGFAMFFFARDESFLALPWRAPELRVGPRVRLVAEAPWRTVEIGADSIADPAVPAPEAKVSTALFNPAQTLDEPMPCVELALPQGPPALAGPLFLSAVALSAAVGAGVWYLTPGRPHLSGRAYAIGIFAGFMGTIILVVTAGDVLRRWIPSRRRRARDRAGARRELDALGTGVPAAGVPVLCRLIALAHGCTAGDVRGLTHDVLRGAEDRYRVRLPRTWVVADADAEGTSEPRFAELGAGTPALYKVTRPVPWQDRTSSVLVGALVIGMVTLAGAGAGVFGTLSSAWSVTGVCCAGPVALFGVFGVVESALGADLMRRGRFLVLSRRGPVVCRGAGALADPHLGPPDAFTILHADGAPLALNKPPVGAFDANEEEDEPGRRVRHRPVRRVRVVAGPPWGERDGLACYVWVPVAGTSPDAISGASTTPRA